MASTVLDPHRSAGRLKAHERQLAWAMVLAVFVVCAAAHAYVGIGIALSTLAQIAIIFAPLAGVLYITRRGGDLARISNAVQSLSQALAVLLLGQILSYAAATSGAPFTDALLFGWDKWLGLDWFAYAHWIDQRPWLVSAMNWSYASLVPQLLVAAFLLGLGGHNDQAAKLTIALAISLLAANFFFALMPAVSLYAHLNIDLTAFHNIAPICTTEHVAQIEAFRAGTAGPINLDELNGLITFPSFHTAGAILLIWAFWPIRTLRIPGLIVNLLMLAATPIDGAHYFVDVAAGFALALASIALANAMLGMPGWLGTIRHTNPQAAEATA